MSCRGPASMSSAHTYSPPTPPLTSPRSYGCYLLFQLKTHAHLFSSDADSTETPALSLSGSTFMLTTITIAVAICSE